MLIVVKLILIPMPKEQHYKRAYFYSFIGHCNLIDIIPETNLTREKNKWN